ncbi:MAG: hypothetical protein NZ480_04290 [Bdellovibrionaceae bacterium]|nr:hypothetical protein [Pseudobdellovibrionaceae bacterium]MDW8189966.1 hypothetical protein [Pseudobdellovibrionaceae bacterium]
MINKKALLNIFIILLTVTSKSYTAFSSNGSCGGVFLEPSDRFLDSTKTESKARISQLDIAIKTVSPSLPQTNLKLIEIPGIGPNKGRLANTLALGNHMTTSFWVSQFPVTAPFWIHALNLAAKELPQSADQIEFLRQAALQKQNFTPEHVSLWIDILNKAIKANPNQMNVLFDMPIDGRSQYRQQVTILTASQYLRLIYKAFNVFEKEVSPISLFGPGSPHWNWEAKLMNRFMALDFNGPLPDTSWKPAPALVPIPHQEPALIFGLLGNYRVLVTNDVIDPKDPNSDPLAFIGFRNNNEIPTFHHFYQKMSQSLVTGGSNPGSSFPGKKEDSFVFFISLTESPHR